MKRFFQKGLLPLALVFFGCSHSTETAVRDLFGGRAESPVFLGCKAVSEQELNFQFSLPVRVVSLNFNPAVEVESIEEGFSVKVKLSQPLGLGVQMVADLLVEDEGKNTLNVLVPFRARNDRMPQLLITELRTDYSKPRVEFVELRTESAGNLGALRLFIASNGLTEPLFEFPPVEVPQGQYIVVHLRTLEPDCIDETGDDLGLSKGTEALTTARDFWIPESVKRIRKTDTVFLMDQDDRIIDAVLLSENPDSWWSKEVFAQAAELLGSQNAWIPVNGPAGSIPGPMDAVVSTTATATRTICRNESRANSRNATDWYITVSSGATPGKTNNPNVYAPK